MPPELLGIAAIGLYLAAAALILVRLLGREQAPAWLRRLAVGTGIAATGLHAAALLPLLFTPQGFDLGFFHAASLVGFMAAALLLLSTLTRPLENLGIVILPAAALSIALMFAFPSHRLVPEARSWQLDLHILLSILAYSLLVIAAIQAIVLAIQDRQLHNRHPGGFIRTLPPLQTMEELLFQLIVAGFILLTLSLVTGVLFLEDIFAQHLVHKTILSVAAWVVFGTLLWGRWRFGWRGRKAIRWTLGGFVVLMLAYFGSKLVLELVLHRT